MTELILSKTKVTPLIKLKLGEKLIIDGDSRPEDVALFYAPIIKWFVDLNEEVKKGKVTPPLAITFNLEYLNSSSVIFISKILKQINDIKAQNIAFDVEWLHKEYDEDILDLGEEFNYIYDDLNMNIKSV